MKESESEVGLQSWVSGRVSPGSKAWKVRGSGARVGLRCPVCYASRPSVYMSQRITSWPSVYYTSCFGLNNVIKWSGASRRHNNEGHCLQELCYCRTNNAIQKCYNIHAAKGVKWINDILNNINEKEEKLTNTKPTLMSMRHLCDEIILQRNIIKQIL